MYVCVYVRTDMCVCVWERERESKGEGETLICSLWRKEGDFDTNFKCRSDEDKDLPDGL